MRVLEKADVPEMFYFLKQSWLNLRESWGIALQTVFMMSTVLFLLGAFALLALHVEAILRQWEAEAPVLVYLKADISAPRLASLQTKIKALEEVRSLRLVPSQASFDRLRRSLGTKQSLLEGLDPAVFPTSLEIDLWPWARQETLMQRLSQRLLQEKTVQEVDYGREWFSPIWQMAAWVRAILGAGGLLLLLCSALMAAGTIRLSFMTHQDEIEIMRLIGATEAFLRAPFYLEGIFAGFFSSFLALSGLFGIFHLLLSSYGPSFLAFTSIPMSFLLWWQIGAFLIGGLLAGFFGAWIGIRRFTPRR